MLPRLVSELALHLGADRAAQYYPYDRHDEPDDEGQNTNHHKKEDKFPDS